MLLAELARLIDEFKIWAGLFAILAGLFALAVLLGEQALPPSLGQREWLVTALSLFIITLAIAPIRNLLYRTIGKSLSGKRYEYQKTLQDAAVGMASVRDPGKLLSLTVHIISQKMRLDNVSIFIYEDKFKEYRLKASRGERNLENPVSGLSHNEPLVEWLKEKRKPLPLTELQRWIRSRKPITTESILISDLIQIEEKMKMLKARVCVPSFYRDELLGILVLGSKKTGEFFTRDDLNLFNALADEAAIAIKNSQLYFEINERVKEMEALYQREHRLFMHASVAFAAAIDARDPYTHGHSERVTNYSLAMVDYLKDAPEAKNKPLFKRKLQIATVLHDIGKIGVSDDILLKPARLSPQERGEMEKHPVIGAEIVSHIKGLLDIVGAIRHHHERYDGEGYPDGLRSEQIPFMARIIAVTDTFDAVTSKRVYRQSLSAEMAKEEIRKNSAVQFDPQMVEAFLKAFDEGRIGGRV